MQNPSSPARSFLLRAATLLCAGAPLFAQGAAPSDDATRLGSPPGLAQGTTEEEMWPAATDDGWSKPCLVQWQRSFEDALLVSQAERKPILVAVNMDGEIASEHFAGVRYRSEETAAMMERYVCVIASVYRHTPRDHDPDGERVECPRFGTVTCGEHITAERTLYEIYFDERRIAPRHIVLAADASEAYDVYYSWDTATVFTTFKKGIEGWPEPLESPELGLGDLAKSAAVEHREALEQEYAGGDQETRRAILTTLAEDHVVDQVEVLRAATFGLDLELARLARRALAECETEESLDLMAEVLKGAIETEDRQLLLDAVARMGQTSVRARTLAALHSGLARGSNLIDSEAAFAREYEANAARSVNVLARARAAEADPYEPEALLELAEGLLARALESGTNRFAPLWVVDAHDAALEAERLGASGPRLDAVLALTTAELGDLPAASKRAVAAVEAGFLSPSFSESIGDEDSASALSRSRRAVLRLFAYARQKAIRDAYAARQEWPPEWLSDVKDAYTTVLEGPLGSETPLVEYHDFLRWIGATPLARKVLDDGLARFPDSPVLHERLRGRLLWQEGAVGLEKAYAEWLARTEAAGEPLGQLVWYSGYASLVAAEHHRRRGRFDTALEAYARGIAYYERDIELHPDGRDISSHFIVMAHAGVSRVALERGELDEATTAMLTALQLGPDSAATPDGLSLTPVATAKMLAARLAEAEDAERGARLQAALDTLDPKFLEPPSSELPGTPPPVRSPGRRYGR